MFEGINPDRITWCCGQQGQTVAELAEAVSIAPAMLERVMAGEGALSVPQLRKIAEHFHRGWKTIGLIRLIRPIEDQRAKREEGGCLAVFWGGFG